MGDHARARQPHKGLLSLPIRCGSADGYLTAALQIQLISALNIDRSGARARADYCAYRCAFAAPGNGSNDCAHRRSDCCTLRSRVTATIFVLDGSFIVYSNGLSACRSHGIDNTREPGGLPVP
jgi:hypothetical protein